MKQKFFAQTSTLSTYPGHVAIYTYIRHTFVVRPPYTPSHVLWLVWHDRVVNGVTIEKLLYKPMPSRWRIPYLDGHPDMDQEWLDEPRDHSDNPRLAALYERYYAVLAVLAKHRHKSTSDSIQLCLAALVESEKLYAIIWEIENDGTT